MRSLQANATAIETEDDARWAAVVARDKAADDRFVYAVATTGVYCRPSCPSRRALRSNVQFYHTCDEAETAGFRPCKRCRPDEEANERLAAEKVAEICRLIETSEEEPRLAELAQAAQLSPSHFHRLFKKIVGVTPKAYAEAHRHDRVRHTLKHSASVTAAIHEAGYNASGRFYETSSEILGMAPKAFRAGGRDARITFAIGTCSLGSILVAATDKGICAILLGDEPEPLLRDLHERFSNAELTGGDRKFERLVAKVIALVDAPPGLFDLPLDIRGTAFQHRVWQALRAIPAGTTASYADIAAAIGAPKAVRAVASACAANAIAVAVPCHRVVRTDGSLSGYRWGLARKRALIEKEKKRE